MSTEHFSSILVQLLAHNDIEARSIDGLFASHQVAQQRVRELESAIESERGATQTVVDSMDPTTAAQYQQLHQEGVRVEQVSMI